MDLGLTSDGGQYVRFMPSVNAWFVDGKETEIKGFRVDPSSIKTGWGKIAEGEAPDYKWDEQLGVRSMQPSPEHRRGFSLMLHIKDVGWREWSAVTVGALQGVTALWSAVDPKIKDNPGKAVVVKYTGSRAETKGKGNTRIPLFEVVGWEAMPSGEELTPEAPKVEAIIEDEEALF